MADQHLDTIDSTFTLDLHGCSTQEGYAVVACRIRECHAYGIEELRIVFGSAEHAHGTLREVVESAIGEAHGEVADSSYRDVFGLPAVPARATELRLILNVNRHPRPQDRSMVFAAFSAKYDSKCQHHPPYYPVRSSAGAPGSARRRKGARQRWIEP